MFYGVRLRSLTDYARILLLLSSIIVNTFVVVWLHFPATKEHYSCEPWHGCDGWLVPTLPQSEQELSTIFNSQGQCDNIKVNHLH